MTGWLTHNKQTTDNRGKITSGFQFNVYLDSIQFKRNAFTTNFLKTVKKSIKFIQIWLCSSWKCLFVWTVTSAHGIVSKISMQCHVMQLVWCDVMWSDLCVCVCVSICGCQCACADSCLLACECVCVCARALCLFEETVQISRSNRTEITIGTISTLSSNGPIWILYSSHRICVNENEMG